MSATSRAWSAGCRGIAIRSSARLLARLTSLGRPYSLENEKQLDAMLAADVMVEVGDKFALIEFKKYPGNFDENVSPAPAGIRPIPVISAVQAGQLKDMENPYSPGDGYSIEYTDQKLSRWAFALEVEGESMMPIFKPGDRLIVDPDLAPQPGDFVIARNGSDQATFKKYRPRGMDENGNMIFELVPLNDDYPTMRSDIEHLIVIGVVTEHRKKLRRV